MSLPRATGDINTLVKRCWRKQRGVALLHECACAHDWVVGDGGVRERGSSLLSALSWSPLRLLGVAAPLAGGQVECVEMTPPGRQRFSFISLLPDHRRADIG